MLGHAGAEGVGRQRVLAAQQFEIFRRDGEVEDALLRADGATALLQQIQIDPGAEADSAAMAAALTVFKHWLHLFSRLSARKLRRMALRPTGRVLIELRDPVKHRFAKGVADELQ